jgi:predicted Rossmann fold flavoprotein
VGAATAQKSSETLQNARRDHAKKAVVNACPFDMPNRLWRQLVLVSGISESTKWADSNKASLQELNRTLTQCKLQVLGKNTFKEEFVTAGGVDLKEIDFKRFESKLFPGLYFAGEVLNIDAITGGYNFQAAWTGGWIAGNTMSALPD